MSHKPKITSLQPIVLADKRRITLNMTVEGLPAPVSNIMFMPDTPASPEPASGNSPYPNLELSILNNHRQPVASLMIIEHQEKDTSLTLHLPSPDPEEMYTARAEMSYQDEIIDVVEVPFRLDQEGLADG